MRVDQIFKDGVCVEALEHHGDGTGTRVTYEGGKETSREEVRDLPVDVAPEPSDLAKALARVDKLTETLVTKGVVTRKEADDTKAAAAAEATVNGR